MKTIFSTLFIFLIGSTIFLNISKAQLVADILAKCKDGSDCIINECFSKYASDSEKISCYTKASRMKDNPTQPYQYVSSKTNHVARGIVIQSVELNKLHVGGREFETMANPKGDGVFVYDPRTRFSGVERYLIWMVIKDQAYPLNGPSKMVTPSLKWPRDADPEVWQSTGLGSSPAIEAIFIIFGK